MDIYTSTLFALILANVAIATYRFNDKEGRASLRTLISQISGLFRSQDHSQQGSKRLVLIFLPVYVLVMASDWMQVGYHFSLDSYDYLQ